MNPKVLLLNNISLDRVQLRLLDESNIYPKNVFNSSITWDGPTNECNLWNAQLTYKYNVTINLKQVKNASIIMS